LLTLVLALGASAAWGSADFLGGRASRGVGALGVATFSKVAGAAGLAVAAVVAGDVPSRAEAGWAIGAGLFGAVGLLELYRALAIGPMSLVAPLTACGGAVPVIAAFATGDVPGPLTGAGLFVAFAGALIVSRPPDDEAATPGMKRSALLHSLVAATALGLGLTFLQQAAQAPGDATLGLSLAAALTTATVLVAISASRGALAVPPLAFLPAVIGCGMLDVTANVLFAQASAEGQAATVAVLGSLYPLATVFLARAWLGERLSTIQGAGVLAAMAGVAAIAAGA
jgi:drug/metabolite transporter (DMT)-like permease